MAKRNIPSTMATQHPDNARTPFWKKHPFIKTHQEIYECFDAFNYLGIEEYMWDWEGKHADAAVVDKLLSKYYTYFSKNILGTDRFLTFRIPNIWEEKGYNLLQVMTVILASEDFARDLEYRNRPLFEVILPMTVRADQLIRMHDLFNKVAAFKTEHFAIDSKSNTDMLELIPLVESAASQRKIGTLLDEYISLYKEVYGKKPEYIRPFIACSDPALTEGFLATRISNKLALIEIYRAGTRNSVPMYPIAGAGSLPFRGGLSPFTVDEFISNFPGLSTTTIQSAFRYDYPIKDVVDAIRILNKRLGTSKIPSVSLKKQLILENIAAKSSKIYRSTLSKLVSEMQPLFDAVPKRRERRQHVGLLAYKRKSGGMSFPRAITFTAGFYSIGIPPEFISSGRILASLTDEEREIVLEFVPGYKSAMITAGRYLNKTNLAKLSELHSGWKEIALDVAKLEKIFGLRFGPITKNQKKHRKLTALLLLNITDPKYVQKLIEETGILRHSIG